MTPFYLNIQILKICIPKLNTKSKFTLSAQTETALVNHVGTRVKRVQNHPKET